MSRVKDFSVELRADLFFFRIRFGLNEIGFSEHFTQTHPAHHRHESTIGDENQKTQR
jgi:hypothetical protein